MPGIPVGYEVNDKTINEVGDIERKARIDAIHRLRAYYDGRHRDPLKVEPGETNDNIIINLCGRVIDKTVEFMGVPSKIELPGGVDNVPDPANPTVLVKQRSADQQLLDELWERNELAEFVEEVEQSGSVAGHTFLRLIDGDEPSVALLDPCYVTVFWNISNIKQTLFYRLQWDLGKKTMRQDIVPVWLVNGQKQPGATMTDNGDGTYTEQSNTGWKILEYEKTFASKKWTLTAEDDWEYPFAPILEWGNRRKAHEYYGETDLRQPRLNDAINFIASNTGRIIKFHAHPKTVITGLTGEIDATSVDGLYILPDAEARAMNLEMQSDLSSSLNFLNLLRSEFFSTHRVLDVSSIKDKLGQITNFSMQVLFGDQIDNTTSKRGIYGAGFAEVSRRLLWMMGKEYDAQPVVTWDDPLPVNRLEQLQAAQIEQGLGTTSDQTIAEDLGRDYTAEQAKKTEEVDKKVERQADNITKFQMMGAV